MWGNNTWKNVILRLQHIKIKGDHIPLLLFWDVVQNVDSVVCILAEQHQSAGRWIIFGGICTFCNMLMSKAAKARLPGERRGEGEEEKREGAEWKRKKQTEAGVNYGCNLRFPRGKRKAERNLKSCISDYAFTTFSYHGPWANSYTIWPLCVCMRACDGVWDGALTYSSVSGCAELCCAVRKSPNLSWCDVRLKLRWLPLLSVSVSSVTS